MASVFVLANEDLLQNILSRLPALSFASASCVSKPWNEVCNRILSRPKLASALSLSPSHRDAVEEVLSKVLSEPIRPHFALACVGLQFSLAATHQLITERLGSRIPIITNAATGIIGRDARTNELREMKWEILEEFGLDYGGYNEASELNYCGIVLLVGYVPGLKVDTIPLLRPKMDPKVAMVDKFMIDIRHYTASVSGCESPTGIILFGDQRVDLKPILAEMDYDMPEETVIVGDASACFLFRSRDVSRNFNRNSYFCDAVALVFARDKDKSDDRGEIRFHLTLSTGVIPFGPQLTALSVKVHNSDCSWLTARIEGYSQIVDGQGLLEEINDQIDDEYPYLYIGVTHQRKCSIGSHNSAIPRSYLSFYEVLGGNKQYFAVDGLGIKPGDSFIFYHSDNDTASFTCNIAFEDLRLLKAAAADPTRGQAVGDGVTSNGDDGEKEVLGGLIFSCCSRSDSLSGRANAESLPFSDNFPGTPLAGVFCAGEIGRAGGSSSLIRQADGDEDGAAAGRCFLHHYSTVYLVMSYSPPPPASQP